MIGSAPTGGSRSPATRWILQEKLRHGGAAGLALDALGRCGLRLTPYYLIAESPRALPPSLTHAARIDLECRLLGAEDLPIMGALPGRGVAESEMRQRLKDGRVCFVAAHRGRVVAFNWIDRLWCSSRLCRFALQPHEAYLFDVFTWPAYRGMGIAPCLRRYTYQYLADRGIERVYTIVYALNRPAVRVSRKLAARFLRLGLFIRVGGRREYNLTLRESFV